MQLQLHYTNYITPQLQLRYTTTTTTAALHHTTSSSCGWGDRPGDHCNHCSPPKKHSSNHLWVHQWIRSAIHPWFTTTNLSYRLSIFETSATALCGTTGIYIYTRTYRIHVHHFLQLYVRMFVYGILRPQSCYIGTLGLTQPLNKYMDPCGSLFQSEVAVVEGTHWACHNAPIASDFGCVRLHTSPWCTPNNNERITISYDNNIHVYLDAPSNITERNPVEPQTGL